MLLLLTIVALWISCYATSQKDKALENLNSQLTEKGKSLDKAEQKKTYLAEKSKSLTNALIEMLEIFAKSILTDIGAQNNPNVRVTLYGRMTTSKGGFFIPLARASYNPVLEKIGRKKYPDSEGYIRRVWEECKTDVWTADCETEKAIKKKFVNELNMPKNTVEKLTMIPNSLSGIRLDDNASGDKIGLVILESKDQDKKYLVNHLDDLTKEEGMLNCVSKVIKSLGPYLPNLARGPRS